MLSRLKFLYLCLQFTYSLETGGGMEMNIAKLEDFLKLMQMVIMNRASKP